MNEFFPYLFKVSAGLGILFLPYYFLLRNDPNLLIKRFYLLTGLVAAWIFPLITIRRPELLVSFTPTVFIDPSGPSPLPLDLNPSRSDPGFTIHWITILMITYFTGLMLMFLKNTYTILKWNRTWQRSNNGEGMAFTRSDQVFTIFSRIFIPSVLKGKKDLGNVLLHERAHIHQFHYIDLVLSEVTLLFTWFNPFSWLISRMIKENHEHLADRQVLRAGVSPAQYRAQLLNYTLGVNVFRLGNQFNHSLTLKRFNMMKKPERSSAGIIKIAMLVPVVLLTIGLTTGMTPQQKTINGTVLFADTDQPARGAAIIIKGTTTGTITDENGEFLLNVDGDPEIVISYVGYSTITIKTSRINSKPLRLDPKPYRIDLESVPLEAPDKSTGTVSITGSISIRGSDGGENEPVIVLDGEVVSEIDDLDPNTIDHIEVIKDPDHELVNKYNATGGVILISTKENGTVRQATGVAVVNSGQKEVQPDDDLFTVVEEMPSFPGGEAALKRHIYSQLVYPARAKNQGITGEVLVQFAVTPTGKLEDIRVVRSSYQGFDQAALDVVESMPDWKPAIQNGKPVRMQVIVPVRFETEGIILDQ